MEVKTATETLRKFCLHCGLPVTVSGPSRTGGVFCCHACRLVAGIVGTQEQGEHSWNLLRLGFGTLLSMEIMMISLLFYTGSIEPQAVSVFRSVLLGLSVLALAILLPPFIASAIREASEKKPGLDALIAGGSIAAFVVSAVNTLRGSGAIYFDTATMLPVLVTFGRIIESTAKTRAADLLRNLESLLPVTALRITPEGTAEVGIDLLRAGDLVRVRPGERIAVDGRIREGTTTIEEAAFTGEFLPRFCSPGDKVVAGTINGVGALIVEAEQTGRQLLLHGIIAMIGDAWLTPSKAERIAERMAALFIPVVLVIAAGSVLGWTIFGNSSQGWLSALSVLVVACPCTMGIATPLATSLAIARAAKAGIVVRGGRVMEQLGATDLVFFDKTGTITTGQPIIQAIQRFDSGVTEDELLGRLAALESASEHALGRAIVAVAKARRIEAGSVTDVRVHPGSGISGMVTWQGRSFQVTAGTAPFVRSDSDYPFPEGSCTAIDVAWEGKIRGRLLLSDTLRSDASWCIEALRERGIPSVLLSGDRFAAAAAIAGQIGIERTLAPRKPAEKLEAIKTSINGGRMVVMVGDGINDAPALAAAHAGIAFGAGMDLARQAGNVVMFSDRLGQVPWLISLGRKTRKIIHTNFAWSFGYNAIALAAAATGLLHPLLAAVAMVVSSITVLGNSMRVSRFPDEEHTGLLLPTLPKKQVIRPSQEPA